MINRFRPVWGLGTELYNYIFAIRAMESRASAVNLIFIMNNYYVIIESVDSISKDERGFPLTQYITNGRISRGGYTFTHFKHHHRVLRLISYRMGV